MKAIYKIQTQQHQSLSTPSARRKQIKSKVAFDAGVQIDRVLTNFLKNYEQRERVCHQFKKISDGIYTFNKQKVEIHIVGKQQLIVREIVKGTQPVTIEIFMQLHNQNQLNKSLGHIQRKKALPKSNEWTPLGNRDRDHQATQNPLTGTSQDASTKTQIFKKKRGSQRSEVYKSSEVSTFLAHSVLGSKRSSINPISNQISIVPKIQTDNQYVKNKGTNKIYMPHD